MTKIGMFKTNRKFGKFEFREFEFVSRFRYSDFEFAQLESQSGSGCTGLGYSHGCEA
jgi:hypothetical protein